MVKKEKQLYRCTFVLNGQHDPYCDFYMVYAYSPCHAWQIVCKHLVEFCGVPMDSIHEDTIKVNFKYPNFLK